MANTKKRTTAGKRKAKIKFTQKTRIVEKNDATRMSRYNDTIPMMKRVMPQDNGANFKIRIRKKG